MSKKDCNAKRERDGSYSCNCETCRFSHQDLLSAKAVSGDEMQSWLSGQADDDGPHDPTPDAPSVYDFAHAEEMEGPPTVQLCHDLAGDLRSVIAYARDQLKHSEHKSGKTQLLAHLADVERSAQFAEQLGALVAADLNAGGDASNEQAIEDLVRAHGMGD